MGKMYNTIEDLLEEMTACFEQRKMFQLLEERDIVSILPIKDAVVGEEFLRRTNQVLAEYFDIHDELCYPEDALEAKEENPVFFWKDYLNCFFDMELIDDEAVYQKFLGTSFGIYQITKILFIDEVNKRFRQRRLNGMKLDYKVKATPMDRHQHWNRTYDKDF